MMFKIEPYTHHRASSGKKSDVKNSIREYIEKLNPGEAFVVDRKLLSYLTVINIAKEYGELGINTTLVGGNASDYTHTRIYRDQ